MAKRDPFEAAARARWGAERYDRLFPYAQRHAAVVAGELDDLENEVGTNALLDGFLAIGERFGLRKVPASLIREAVRGNAKLRRLKGDPEFMERYRRGDLGAGEALRQAFEEANPELPEEEIENPWETAVKRELGV